MNTKHNIDVIVFDVNETLLDITTLEPFFLRLFNNPLAMRNWFAELVLYSQAITVSGLYEPFGNLAVACLKMVANNHSILISDENITQFKNLMANLPAHPDVIPTLTQLKSAGFRLATLTNSAPTASPTLLEKAGISEFFEAQLSVDSVKCFKPHPATYHYAAKVLKVEPKNMCLVACHLWDTLGAQAIGCSGAFITRPNNNLLLTDNIPQPSFIAKNLLDFAEQLTAETKYS